MVLSLWELEHFVGRAYQSTFQCRESQNTSQFLLEQEKRVSVLVRVQTALLVR